MQEVKDSDLNFDPAKIEQMQVEFKTCPHCGGAGYRNNSIYSFTCPVCHGTGDVEKEGQGDDGKIK